jgi:cellulose biosynthesis protein BcsQ
MAVVLTLSSVKGGVSKTTTSLFFSTILSDRGKKTLLVDFDPQNALTSYFVKNYSDIEGKTIFDVLVNKCELNSSIINLRENLFFIPSDISLSDLTEQLVINRDFRLFSVFENIFNDYDYIIFDTTANIHIETRLPLVISNRVVIPVNFERWSARAALITHNFIISKIVPLQKIIKTTLDSIHILPCEFEKNRTTCDKMMTEFKDTFQDCLLNPITKREDVKKLSFIDYKDVDLKKLEAYKEYETALNEILKHKARYHGIK